MCPADGKLQKLKDYIKILHLKILLRRTVVHYGQPIVPHFTENGKVVNKLNSVAQSVAWSED